MDDKEKIRRSLAMLKELQKLIPKTKKRKIKEALRVLENIAEPKVRKATTIREVDLVRIIQILELGPDEYLYEDVYPEGTLEWARLNPHLKSKKSKKS